MSHTTTDNFCQDVYDCALSIIILGTVPCVICIGIISILILNYNRIRNWFKDSLSDYTEVNYPDQYLSEHTPVRKDCLKSPDYNNGLNFTEYIPIGKAGQQSIEV